MAIENDDGVDKRVVGGEEQYAFWVPLTGAEGKALAKKAKAENVNVRYLIGNLLRGWMGASELSTADLDAVVGGVSGLTFSLQDVQPINTASQIKPLPMGMPNTTMCAW